MLPGILINRVQARKVLRGRSVNIEVLKFGKAVRNSVQRGVRLGQNA